MVEFAQLILLEPRRHEGPGEGGGGTKSVCQRARAHTHEQASPYTGAECLPECKRNLQPTPEAIATQLLYCDASSEATTSVLLVKRFALLRVAAGSRAA
jgi:hypothetical protein